MNERERVFRLTLAAMLAAFAFICFSYLRLEIPMGGGMTGKIYLGHTFIVLAGLLLGPKYGGLAGALGLSLADLMAGYVTSAPPTFVAKFIIGYTCGMLAHQILHIDQLTQTKRICLTAFAAAGGALLLNILTEPLIRYAFKTYLLGYAEQIAYVSAVNCAVSMAVSAVPSLFLSVFLYVTLLAKVPAVRQRLFGEAA